jgi:hypothetical protein
VLCFLWRTYCSFKIFTHTRFGSLCIYTVVGLEMLNTVNLKTWLMPFMTRGRRSQWPLGCWDSEFESRSGHGCLSIVLSCVGNLCDELITRPEESYRASNCVWLINLKRKLRVNERGREANKKINITFRFSVAVYTIIHKLCGPIQNLHFRPSWICTG